MKVAKASFGFAIQSSLRSKLNSRKTLVLTVNKRPPSLCQKLRRGMHFLQGKGENFPFPITNILIFLVILIFGRRKQQESAQPETLPTPSSKKCSFPPPTSLSKTRAAYRLS